MIAELWGKEAEQTLNPNTSQMSAEEQSQNSHCCRGLQSLFYVYFASEVDFQCGQPREPSGAARKLSGAAREPSGAALTHSPSAALLPAALSSFPSASAHHDVHILTFVLCCVLHQESPGSPSIQQFMQFAL